MPVILKPRTTVIGFSGPGDLIARVENGIGLCLERARFPGGNETICLMGHYMF